jgi:hypothetical protein
LKSALAKRKNHKNGKTALWRKLQPQLMHRVLRFGSISLIVLEQIFPPVSTARYL